MAQAVARHSGEWLGFVAALSLLLPSTVVATEPDANTIPAGTITINDGAALTRSPTVTLTLTPSPQASWATLMALSNDGVQWSEEPFVASRSWQLAPANANTLKDNLRTVHVKFGYPRLINTGWMFFHRYVRITEWSAPASDTIDLDITVPTISRPTDQTPPVSLPPPTTNVPPPQPPSQPLPPSNPNPPTAAVLVITSLKDGDMIGARASNGHTALLSDTILSTGGSISTGDALQMTSMVGDPIGLDLSVVPPTRTPSKPAPIRPITVEGTTSNPMMSVVVNGVPAVIQGTTFRAEGVPITHEGANTLTATGTDRLGQATSQTIIVWQAGGRIPTITFLEPAAGSKLYVGLPVSLRVTTTDNDGEPVTCQQRLRDGQMLRDWGGCDAMSWTPTELQAGRAQTIEVHARRSSGGETVERAKVYVVHQPVSPSP